MQRTRWIMRWSVALLVLAFLLAAGAPAEAAPKSYHPNRIEAALLARVLADPDAEYDVIVEGKTKRLGAVETSRAAVKLEGGKAKFGLRIVRATAAQIKGSRLLKLSRNSDIDYISSDRPMSVTWDPAFDAGRAGSPGVLAVKAPSVWQQLGVTGKGVGVAVVDSGVHPHPDLAGRIVAAVDFTSAVPTTSNVPLTDLGGHGTHVAGLIAGDGKSSDGVYTGVAPQANIIDVRVIDANGNSNTSIVLRGLQWVLANKATYNIKVVNLSLGSHVSASYKNDVLATAAEVLIFSGITVVVSAGNTGPGPETITSPANDPYVITVGAADVNGTASLTDDLMATFSSRGRTKIDRVAKPDLVAPGRKVVSLNSPGSSLSTQFPERLVTTGSGSSSKYFTLSGTSMAAPMVAGTVALMLERNPTLTPAQVKKRLKSTTSSVGYGALQDRGAGMLDAFAAVSSINADKEYSPDRVSDSFAKDMRKFIERQPITWKSLAHNLGVDSKGITWDGITWENITWDGITWENITWENFTWDGITWEGLTWESVTWESTGALSGTGSGWNPVD